MDVLESGTGVHRGTAGDADFDAAASRSLAVVWALVGGLRAVVDDLGEWGSSESGQLGSREDGGRAESKDEAHEAGEVDSSGDHCCGRIFVLLVWKRK